MTFSRRLARWFPVPRILSPLAVGVDITDASVKWLTFTRTHGAIRVGRYGTEVLTPGIVERGTVHDPQALADVLKVVKKKSGTMFAHAALPEEDAYVFSTFVPPRSSRIQAMDIVEFELEGRVPLKPDQAVYDFDTIAFRSEKGEEIAVSVFPRDLAEGYTEAFRRAGIELLSLEIEARSIARAISERARDTALIVDCGYARTGVAIVRKGIPVFTSTIDAGGMHLSKAVMDALSIDAAAAQEFKNEHGVVPDDTSDAKGREALDKVAGALADEIARHCRSWDSHRRERGEQSQTIECVYLTGGGSNMKGFPEYIAARVHAHAERPNAWQNAFSFDDYIPPLDMRVSLQFVTAIGLALRAF